MQEALHSTATARDAWEAHAETVKDNLGLWHADMMIPHELALLQVREAAWRLAALWRQDGTREREAVRLLSTALKPRESTASPLLHAQELQERLAFCRALCELCPDFEAEERIPVADTAVKDENAVATLNSPTFQKAISRFAAVLPKAHPIFCQSFTEVCEEVAAGNAAYGLMPLEDSSEGKLLRFYEQIEHFELHIAATADIPTEQDGKQVRVALLHKSGLPPITALGERILECLLFEESESSLPDLLTVAGAESLTLRRIDSLPSSYREDGFSKHLVFEAASNSVGTFLTFLALFMPRTVITADYINLIES